MRPQLARSVFVVFLAAGIISCGDNSTGPTSVVPFHVAPRSVTSVPLAGSRVVISQVYGGGGNSGATYKNDFIELYNGGTDSVDLSGSSVQYASTTGTSWQVTMLTGKVGPGRYYLVQEAQGAGGTTSLPTPDATGAGNGIAMASGAGKVALVSSTTGLSGIGCPFVTSVVDFVGFGSTANCFEGSGPTPAPSNTMAAIRKSGGQQDTNDNSADFSTGAPTPRNTASDALPPVDQLAVAIAPLASTVLKDATVNFTATATMDGQNVDITSAAWTSSNHDAVTIDPATGVAQAVGGGTSTIGVTVQTASGSASATTTLIVNTATITPSTTTVSEIHYDNAGTDAGESIEIEGDANSSVEGWTLVLYDGNGGMPYGAPTGLTGTIPATCGARGVLRFDFPVNGIQNGPDGWALVNGSGQVVEFKSYEGTFAAGAGPALGLTSVDIGVAEDNITVVGKSLQRAMNGVWFGPAANTFGACNSAEPPPPPPPQGTISVQPRGAPLPVGFQTQLFLNPGGVDGQGHPVGNTDVTWTTSDQSIVSVNAATGVITAKAVGTATLTATATPDGVTTASTSIETYVAPVGASARVGHNTELGTPSDANPNDDVIITRRQYTMSYNASHGDPNWVSWNLDASHKGSSARCNCFTADTALTRLGLPAYNTNDWINGGIWSRGHMSPSADWADADGDNAPTFFLSNMLPQNQALNGGAWGDLENHLRDLATGSTEIYIVAGGIFTRGRTGGLDGFGFMNSTGHIAVPDSVWKIAIVVPDGRSAGMITDPSQVQVIAANFPNDLSGTGTWNRYATTIDAIQRSTRYDFLSVLPESIQCRLETRNCAPTAVITSSIGVSGWQTNEGQLVTFSAATSRDADVGDILSYQWSVNGAEAGSGQTLDHTFANDGTYEVRLVVSDDKGASDVASVNVFVLNVPPAINTFAGATLLRGEQYMTSGNFSDPGADTWAASVNYGDGGGASPLSLTDKSFDLVHTYSTAGSFTVTVSVSDGSATTSATASVVVKSAGQGIADVDAMVVALGEPSGPLNSGQVRSLRVKLENANRKLADGDTEPALNMLDSFLHELQAEVQSARVSSVSASRIVAYTHRVMNSVNAP